MLPPFLLQETFNEENTSAANMLVKFTKIVKQRATEEVMNDTTENSEIHPEESDEDDDTQKILKRLMGKPEVHPPNSASSAGQEGTTTPKRPWAPDRE